MLLGFLSCRNMPNLVIPIRFGSVSEGRVSPQHEAFHTALLRLERLESDRNLTRTTLPISINYEHRVSPDEVAEEIARIADGATEDALLLDVGGPDERDVCRQNIIRGIANAIYLLVEKNRFSKIILFFAISISDKDVAAKFLFPVATANKVAVIFGDGTGHNIPERLDVYKEKMPGLLEAATVDVVEKLKRKLVRHIGFFSFEHNEEVVPHLFDGAECREEIYQVLLTRMVKDEFARYSTIYYDIGASSWFKAPFTLAAEAAGLLEKIRPFDASKDAVSLLNTNACVYFPIIRTGSAIVNVCAQVLGLNAGNSVLFYSLLSTKGGSPKAGRRPVSVVGASGQAFSINVSYDVLVTDVDGDIQRVWKEYPGEKHSETGTRDWKLSSCAAWGMILEAGLVDESYKPKTREFIGYIPNSSRIAELNGPFIAQRISRIMKERYGKEDGTNLVLVCPKEAHALKIVESLRELSGCSYIAIGRDVIDYAVEKKEAPTIQDLRDRFESESPEFDSINQLLNVVKGGIKVENPDVVIFDEFSFSGRTFSGLSIVVAAIGLSVKCTICLLDLSGNRRPDEDLYALYDLDYSRWASVM
ncbi:MAG: hypothetical protein ABIL01_30110 [Pseudomonadota bacterium]